MSEENETGMQTPIIQYRGDEEMDFIDLCCFTHLDLQEGDYIIGLKLNTDDPSGEITRLDFLYGNGKATVETAGDGSDAAETPTDDGSETAGTTPADDGSETAGTTPTDDDQKDTSAENENENETP